MVYVQIYRKCLCICLSISDIDFFSLIPIFQYTLRTFEIIVWRGSKSEFLVYIFSAVNYRVAHKRGVYLFLKSLSWLLQCLHRCVALMLRGRRVRASFMSYVCVLRLPNCCCYMGPTVALVVTCLIPTQDVFFVPCFKYRIGHFDV